ncbi:Protein priB [Tolypocladium ophioglossoides CBS 100239]|uniref:Protein priB n=1 Tax=Tolypocladium ophioglossoides (strain CBS 100239) TaxID=1163406 RepID=A0A0L0N3C1_TOLOC|nr:Protein priB [Tolypocladium ophioglossoides CBS 100239]
MRPTPTLPPTSLSNVAECSTQDNSQGSRTPTTQGVEGIPVGGSDNLQPSGLLNHEAMKGKFSLRHILSTGDGEPFVMASDVSTAPAEDPIRLGLVNLLIAKSLFENFMTVLNPYICQLDPILHTFPRVRERSPFLLSTVLAMSAKSFNPALYSKLHEHAQDLFTEAFRRGIKSTETVQAILILTYWKEPQDTRVWNSLGYAIRMCMDMGWHKLAPQTQTKMANDEKRELRNIERTWYVLFVYDRSMSLQTGKPWMMEHSDFMESIEAWCFDPLATPNDRFLGAFVMLRLETSAAFPLLVPRPPRGERPPLRNVESLLSLMNDRIERWESRWIERVESNTPVDEKGCHPFLIRFYGTHLRLQLFSLLLQDELVPGNSDITLNLERVWVAYSSAVDMLHLISRHSALLYFAQDSVHVMTAYSAAFLVKLPVLAPESVVGAVESTTIHAMRTAARAFFSQAGPPGSSCALQAKFLNNIASKLSEKGKERRDRPADISVSDKVDVPTSYQNQQVSTADSGLLIESDGITPQPSERATPEISALQQGNLDLLFADVDAWANMFSSAGFNTQDGVFLP